jgi:hypothetical protein
LVAVLVKPSAGGAGSREAVASGVDGGAGAGSAAFSSSDVSSSGGGAVTSASIGGAAVAAEGGVVTANLSASVVEVGATSPHSWAETVP